MEKTSFVNHDEALLCAMVQCETVEECICKIKASLAEGATAFGIQLCKIKKELRTKENFTKIFEACEGKPIYVTSYRYSENDGYTDEQCVEVLLLAIESGATIVDIMGDMYDRGSKWELTENPEAIAKQKALIEKIHAMGGEVLMSSHTSSNLTVEETLKVAKAHEERGADVVKIVNRVDALEGEGGIHIRHTRQRQQHHRLMDAAVLDLHFLAADIHHIELRQKLGIETDGIELDLTFDAVGIDDLPYGDIFYAHTLFSFSVSRRYYSENCSSRQEQTRFCSEFLPLTVTKYFGIFSMPNISAAAVDVIFI